MRYSFILSLIVGALCSAVHARVFIPENAGVLNVRDAEFGAIGDGKTDDTAAIQKALSQALDTHRIVYLPEGTYLVSDTLKWWREGYNIEKVNGWGAFLQLQGDGADKTLIQLADNAAGFEDKENPRAVIATGSRGYHGTKKRYKIGEGNEAFANHLRGFTVDVGSDNPGAIGIDYQVSNSGGMRDVVIRANDSSGAIGLSLRRRDNGPGIISDVTISGFDVGISAVQVICQMAFYDIRLVGQKALGVDNANGILAFENLQSQNQVPAIRNTQKGYLTLISSSFEGGSSEHIAVENVDDDSVLIARNVQASGYAHTIVSRDEPVDGSVIAFFTSDGPIKVGSGARIELPIKQTPVIKLSSDPNQWAGIAEPGTKDVTEQLQAELDSGKPLIYIGAGQAFISKPLRVPPTVRAIVGFGTQLDARTTWPKDEGGNDQPLFVIEGESADALMIDRMTISGRRNLLIHHKGARPVVIRDLLVFGGNVYRNSPGAGALFIENVAGGGYHFTDQRVFGRQWNTEGPTNTIDNSRVYALGYKHEGERQLFDIRNNSQLELHNGFLYTFGKLKPENPPIVMDPSARATISIANHTFVGNGTFPVIMQVGEKQVERGDLFSRGGGIIAPILQIGEQQPAD